MTILVYLVLFGHEFWKSLTQPTGRWPAGGADLTSRPGRGRGAVAVRILGLGTRRVQSDSAYLAAVGLPGVRLGRLIRSFPGPRPLRDEGDLVARPSRACNPLRRRSVE